jgi:FixJ family two-component response regulator
VITVVDDDESVREGMTDLLRAMGFTAGSFPSADGFLQSNRLDSTSCLITDVRMPEMTGLELYMRLVQLGKVIPTILITAFPDDRDRARALQAGVACYMAKPFSDDELLASIRLALGPGEAEGK